VVIPPGGFPNNGAVFEVELKNKEKIATEFAIVATGQTPNNQFLLGLDATAPDSLINPANGFIRVRPTLQFQDPLYPNLFAIGDIADSGAHKAARPGSGQAVVAVKNIMALIEGKEPTENVDIGPPGIHMTLGLVRCFHSIQILRNHLFPN
jgi:NADPH-dependent 2,4-dienoyl-CoA reductase/sulfur reductase-like enzyme